MVIDILRWTFQKYRVYCFVAFILLAICLIGYTTLIIYWLQSLIDQTRKRKKQIRPSAASVVAHPPPPVASVSHKTSSPMPLDANDDIREIPESPSMKRGRGGKSTPRRHRARPTGARIDASKPRNVGRAYQLNEYSLTPSPLNQRTSPKRSRRRRFSSRVDDDVEFGGNDKHQLEPRRRMLKLPPFGFATRPPRQTRVSDRLKNEKPAYKQYLFV